MKKFHSLLTKMSSRELTKMSRKELKSITGGYSDSSTGSQTSGTANNNPPCDKTCVCKCEIKL